MDEIATKLLQYTNDPNKYETILTITGVGGFGKTTTVISLCHYPVVNKHFTDGFVNIELGSQASDPSIKLRDLYNLLTGEHCGINVADRELINSQGFTFIIVLSLYSFCTILSIIRALQHSITDKKKHITGQSII